MRGLVELVELGGPHLVLADADGDHRIAVVRELPQLVNRVLLQDAGEVLVVVERFVALPLLALRDPGGNVVRRFDDLVQLGERELHVAAHGDVGRLVLVELRGVDVDVDDLAVLAELFDLAGHAVVEPHAEGDQQIGLVRRRSWRTPSRACRACRAQSGSSLGKAPRPITVIVDGDAGLLGERAELFAGVAADDAAAGVDDRPLGQLDRRGDLLEFVPAWPAGSPVGSRADRAATS